MARIKVFNNNTQTWVYADKSFGKDGESIAITNITESSDDGGSNVVEFSDGKTLTVKNGRAGKDAENSDAVPDYVVAEAMNVLDKVVSAQGSRTFVLGAITDMHYGSSDYINGVVHACQGLKHISERIKLDAIAVLGDYTDEHQMDTEMAVTDLEEMNALLDHFCDNVNLRVKGNHDHRPGAPAQTYRYIFAYNDDVVWGSRIGGYFYRDFPAYKLRVICLNTTEVARDNVSVSDEQYNFFVNALDMSTKDDAEEWGILMLSHHPLDWTVTSGAYRFGNILNAYQTGSSWTDGTISCDYSGKNIAKIVGNIHGHIHNLLTDKIYIGEPGNSEQTSVWRMAVPASRVDFVNHYAGIWNENKWYDKIQNTAKDTSFNIICIDLDAYTIKAFCYGAGYDRELAYAEPPIINLIDNVGYFDNMRLKSDGSYVGEQNYTSSGKIPVSAGDIIRTYGINFDAADYYRCVVHLYVINNTDHSYVVTNSNELPFENDHVIVNIDDANNLTITFKTEYYHEVAITGYGSGANLIVTKNQVISDDAIPESPEEIINLVDTVGYQDNKRVKSDGSYVEETGYASCNKIPVTQGDIFYAGGLNYDAKDYMRGNAHYWYDGYHGYTVTNSVEQVDWDADEVTVTMNDGIVKIIIKSEHIQYISFTGYGSGADMIVTKNQPIQ